MLHRGDIVVERLTGRRAIVIQAEGPEEVRCRFGDGRLDERYTFELERVVPPLTWVLSLVAWPFAWQRYERPPAEVGERVRPMLVRQPTGS